MSKGSGSNRGEFRFTRRLKSARPLKKLLWGCSSVGRALEWHSRGQGFDSPQLHQFLSTVLLISSVLFCCSGLKEGNQTPMGFDDQG